jgi:hypothetical protein
MENSETFVYVFVLDPGPVSLASSLLVICSWMAGVQYFSNGSNILKVLF